MSAQGRFDLAQFDAIAANFHLMVGATLKFNTPVGEETANVPRLIHLPARDSGERVGNELLSGELGALQIAAGHTVARNVDFARYANGRRPQILVEDIDLCIGEWTTDDQGLIFGAEVVESRPHGGFRRSVKVVERRVSF